MGNIQDELKKVELTKNIVIGFTIVSVITLLVAALLLCKGRLVDEGCVADQVEDMQEDLKEQGWVVNGIVNENITLRELNQKYDDYNFVSRAVLERTIRVMNDRCALR